MKERAYIYAGETVVLRFEARKEGQILDLSGYDVEIDIATTAMGTHLVKQSAKGEIDISQVARGMLLCTLSAEDTALLTPGTATIGVRLLHDTFVRMGFDASIEVLRQGATPGAVLSRTAQPVITLHTPCIWVYMDFAATRGDDGITPHIGENGNWFIGDEDTGERALGVTYDDLTPEQIEELQRPATEAATEANKAAQAAKNATESATTATEGAVAAAAMANTATGAATTATTAANRAAAEATAAAGNATTAATEATNAANAANIAAEGIDGKIAGKADLNPATGYIKSSQIAPLEGRQTGVNTSDGNFRSTASALLFPGARTIAANFKTGHDVSGTQTVVATSGDIYGMILEFVNGNLVFRCRGAAPRVVTGIEPDTYYSVAGTYDGNEIVVYLNGGRVTSASNFSDDLNLQYLAIGSSFKGIVIGCRLFNYALTASEVVDLWNGGEPERYMLPLSGEMRTGLVAEYIAAGLLADKWRDTSGAGLDLPYVPTATGGTAVLVYDQPSGDSDAFNVLAASDCSLEARVTALERTLTAVLSGDAVIPALQVRELSVWGSNNLILTGSDAPAKAPDRAGQLYIDTASGAVYKSTGNAAVSDWKNL